MAREIARALIGRIKCWFGFHEWGSPAFDDDGFLQSCVCEYCDNILLWCDDDIVRVYRPRPDGSADTSEPVWEVMP